MKRDDSVLSTAAVRSENKGKKSAAVGVVEQARAKAAAAEKVVPLDAERIEHGENEEGKPTLTAIFPTKLGAPDRVNLNYLLDFPGLKDMFAKCFLAWGRPNAQVTRRQISEFMRSGWFRYLQQKDLNKILPEQIDEQVLSGFNQWLYQQTKQTTKNAGAVQPFHPSTIRHVLGALRVILKATPESRFLAERVPAGPRGARRKSKPTEVLTHAQLVAVWAAAEKDTIAIRDRWVRGRSLLDRGRQMLAAGRELGKHPRAIAAISDATLALCLAMLNTAYPGTIPSLHVLEDEYPLLGKTIRRNTGHKAATGYFYLSGRDLVPLVLLITLATAFNPETVLKLTWNNINRNVDRLGTLSVQIDVTEEVEVESESTEAQGASEPLLKIRGDKPRAGRQILRLLDPTSSDPSQASLNLVLDLLRDMTERIRTFVIPEHANRLFVFVPVLGRRLKVPKGYGSVAQADIASDAHWGEHLSNFVKENDLPPFTLRTLRATLLDFAQLVSGGDLEKGRQAGNHTTRVITWTHYTSDLVRRLLKEATGEILLTRDRWIRTNGDIDPRKTSVNADKACATPGFGCFDPFNSPRPNQKAGRLCDAFGECPACPLAIASPGNPVDVAWWEALQRAIYRSVATGTITASMWLERWISVASDLKVLIEIVPAEVLTSSHRFRVELPNVG